MSEVWTFEQLANQIRGRPGRVRLVGIDGCAGAGKTTFATRLSAALDGAPVVHTDDFASHEDALGWWPRMLRDVIEPLSRHEAATFRPYDWVRRKPGARVTVPAADVVLVEGVAATRSAWRDRLALRIWIDVAPQIRVARGLARDGDQLRGFWEWWRQEEERYVAAERPQEHADLVVDGNPPGRTREAEFVVVSERRAGAAPSPR